MEGRIGVKKVAVLIGKSLLMAGLISRLRAYARQFDLRVVDLVSPNSLQQLSDFQPEIIIFDKADVQAGHPSLEDFLNSIPEATLLELRLDSPNVQIIQSVQLPASNADELVQLFQNGGNLTSLPFVHYR
jgi:hypothetical protein